MIDAWNVLVYRDLSFPFGVYTVKILRTFNKSNFGIYLTCFLQKKSKMQYLAWPKMNDT